MSLHSPFFGYHDQEEAQRQVPLMKVLNFFMPNANVPSYKPHLGVPYFCQHWLLDPLAPQNMPMRSYLAHFKEVADLQDQLRPASAHTAPTQLLRSLTLPLLLTQGGQDTVACNWSSKTAFQAIPITDKNTITYDDCAHQTLADGDWVDVLANGTIGW